MMRVITFAAKCSLVSSFPLWHVGTIESDCKKSGHFPVPIVGALTQHEVVIVTHLRMTQTQAPWTVFVNSLFPLAAIDRAAFHNDQREGTVAEIVHARHKEVAARLQSHVLEGQV
jgi:hypothetical protein